MAFASQPHDAVRRPGASLRPLAGSAAELVGLVDAWLAQPTEPEPLIVETSGSTGTPKRVVLSRRAVLASVAATTERLGARGRWVLTLPPTYVAGLMVIARSLVAGGPPVLLDEQPSLADAVAAAGEPAFLALVPTQLLRLLESPAATAALRCFHTALLGGGPLDPALRRRAEQAGVQVVATYGSSETSGGCVYDGVPLDGVAVELDLDGRIRLGGPMLFDGYAGDPALTGAALVDGWFLTSDLGRWRDDGRLQVLGRVDDVVISGGVKVPTPAVAARIREHPAVSAVEVLGVADPEWGERVVAFVVGEVSLEELRGVVAAELPRSWAPRQLVTLDALPLLANGKTDRTALRELA
ncbi:MAG: AMP-binding protein [Nocardioidaceae bacterium]